MSEISVSDLRQQMRVMAEKARGEAETIIEDRNNFNSILQSALDQVNETQQQSGELKKRFELGDPEVSLAEAMVAGQKSSIAFEATLRVRNKLVQAYQDIMNMPI